MRSTKKNSNSTSMLKMFASNVFSDDVMKKRLPKDIYTKLKRTINNEAKLGLATADVIANAMKNWAIEKGVNRYCHWFHPLTGTTAEKHVYFISPTHGCKTVVEFSGKELIKGELDASSFPSGGLRSTYEARGYSVWDCTSPVFIREDLGGGVLVIPTAFYSYTGEALDKKIPLLRSMKALSKQALRILRIFGNKTATKIISTVGPEQEYFLINRKFYSNRLDLLITGRTLFGAPPPKGQELEDQYFGSIKDRITAYMTELNIELWKMGISAKIQHNEVAPAQYELSTIFSDANIAVDHNQIVMDTMQKVAKRHDFVCLLHEKPFAGISGSGKHNNWSLSSDDGQNLLEPGRTPQDNAQFLVFLVAVVTAVDRYADMLRASIANSGQDHRLGSSEAPPAIVSIFLGDMLTDVLNRIGQIEERGTKRKTKEKNDMKIGVTTLPTLPKDMSDRNRTSPFAFTGNKFEFRMVGSSSSIATPNVVLNTAVCAVLDEIATRLEKFKNKNINDEIQKILIELLKKHKKVIFNGNSYSEEWKKESKDRGLLNIKSTVDALTSMVADKNIKTFEKYHIYSEIELRSRFEIYLKRYVQEINIEALTMINMVKKQIIPATLEYFAKLADSINISKNLDVDIYVQKDILSKISANIRPLQENIDKLEKTLSKLANIENNLLKNAKKYIDTEVLPIMQEIRESADALEMLIPSILWPIPTYAEMLFLSN